MSPEQPEVRRIEDPVEEETAVRKLVHEVDHIRSRKLDAAEEDRLIKDVEAKIKIIRGGTPRHHGGKGPKGPLNPGGA
jgi:hypothetical protein